MAKLNKNSNEEKPFDRQIVLSIQQLVTYSAFVITVGASIYTFFKALPKLDDLDRAVNELKESNGRVEERIIALKETVSTYKKEEPGTKAEEKQ